MYVLSADDNPHRAEQLLRRHLPKSRFAVRFDHERSRGGGRGLNGRWALALYQVRLRHAKPYCGQHAGPCRIESPRPHPICRYLEGADWVAFDDMVNDVLDRHGVEAHVWSAGLEFLRPYFIRRGRLRRTRYPGAWVVIPVFGMHTGSPSSREVFAWDPDEDAAGWSDAHFGVRSDAPRSDFEHGTPGVPEWRAWKARKLERLLREGALAERKDARRRRRAHAQAALSD